METHCRFRPPAEGRLLIWEVSKYCNLRCLHCCTNSGPEIPTNGDLTTAVMTSTATQLSSAGITEAYFSGGEPFLRTDFLDTLSAIDTSRVRVYVATNGYFLSQPSCARLADLRITHITISLDGATAEEHEHTRGKKGAFDRTLKGISNAVAAGLPIRISIMITPRNLRSLHALLTTLKVLQVRSVVLHTVLPIGRAIEHPSLLFPPDRASEVESVVRELVDEFSGVMAVDHSFGGAGSRSLSGCPAQSGVLHIDPSGDVTPCSWLYKLAPSKFTIGNLKSDSLHAIVRSSLPLLDQLRSRHADCLIPPAEALSRNA